MPPPLNSFNKFTYWKNSSWCDFTAKIWPLPVDSCPYNHCTEVMLIVHVVAFFSKKIGYEWGHTKGNLILYFFTLPTISQKICQINILSSLQLRLKRIRRCSEYCLVHFLNEWSQHYMKKLFEIKPPLGCRLGWHSTKEVQCSVKPSKGVIKS